MPRRWGISKKFSSNPTPVVDSKRLVRIRLTDSPTLVLLEHGATHKTAKATASADHKIDEKNWGERRGLNPRPSVPQTDALPAELRSPPSEVVVYTMFDAGVRGGMNAGNTHRARI